MGEQRHTRLVLPTTVALEPANDSRFAALAASGTRQPLRGAESVIQVWMGSDKNNAVRNEANSIHKKGTDSGGGCKGKCEAVFFFKRAYSV